MSTEVYKSPSIAITTSSGCASPQIAEWVMMTALAFNWDFSYLNEKQKQHRWLRTSDGGRDAHAVNGIVGQRIGILGYGSIGRQIARLARAFGMEVFTYTATPKKSPESKMDTGYVIPGTGDVNGEIPARWFSGTDKASLHDFLGQDLDMLVLCTPST
jgi:phosphoglycerate dehydrogenase-like enzyme